MGKVTVRGGGLACIRSLITVSCISGDPQCGTCTHTALPNKHSQSVLSSDCLVGGQTSEEAGGGSHTLVVP